MFSLRRCQNLRHYVNSFGKSNDSAKQPNDVNKTQNDSAKKSDDSAKQPNDVNKTQNDSAKKNDSATNGGPERQRCPSFSMRAILTFTKV